MAKGKKAVELLSSITGKGTTMTAKSLARVANNLETKIRRLKSKDELTDAEKKELIGFEKQLKDVNKEMEDEVVKAGRSMQQAASDRKAKKPTMPEAPFDIPEKRKGGSVKAMPFNKGGMSSRKGNFDMRKGGMFAK